MSCRPRLIRRAAAMTLVAATVSLTSCGSSTPGATPAPPVTATSAGGGSSSSSRASTSTTATGAGSEATDATDATDPTDPTDATAPGATTATDPSATGQGPSEPTTSPRLPPQTGALKPGPITVVTLGDSLTEGQGDDGGTGYPGRLPDLLAAKGRPGSTVVNVGHSGWDTQMLIDGAEDRPSELAEARTAIADAQSAGRPVVALVLIGSNDLWYLYEYGPESGTDAEAEAADVEHYRRNLESIVSDLRTRGAQVVLAINDDQSRRDIATDETRRGAALPATTNAEVAQMSAQARRYATVVRDIASANGLPVADFLESPVYTNRATMSDDGNHPNAQGYDAIAQVWMEAMAPLLG